MFSTEGLPGIGVGGWWAPGLLNEQQKVSAIDEGKKEKKKERKNKNAGEKEETMMEKREKEGTKKVDK